MASLTRRGARNVTTDLDRIANLFQNDHAVLGVPKDYALRFAYYCDVMSDAVEKTAIAHEKKAEEEAPPADEKKDEGEKKEAGCEKLPEGGMRDNCEAKKEEGGDKGDKKESAPPWEKEKKEASTSKKSDDETGLSVDHGASGFDANVIADDVGGPQEILAPIETWMNDFFTQEWFHELDDLQEAGAMGNAAARGQIITKAARSLAAFLARKAEDQKEEDEDEKLLAEMIEEESKKSSKKAEEAKPEEKDEKPAEEKEAAKKAEEKPEEKKDEEPAKTASTHGYNLFES